MSSLLACLLIRDTFQIELEFRTVGFGGEGKPEYPEKNLPEQGREPTTNSTHIWRRVQESNPGHIGGRPAWEANAQPMRHPCSPGKTQTDVDLVGASYKFRGLRNDILKSPLSRVSYDRNLAKFLS